MTVQQFTDYVKKMQHYEEALNVIYWDMRTGAPKKGLAQRSEVIGTLSASLFDMQTSEELGELLAALEAQKADLDYVTLRLVEEVRKNYDQNKKFLRMNTKNSSFFNRRQKRLGKKRRQRIILLYSYHT